MTDSLYVTQVIALYWVVSISMVYLNKILLSNEEASIPAPLFVTWYQVRSSHSLFSQPLFPLPLFQCIITAAICYFFGLIGERTRKLGIGSYFDSYPLVRYNFRSGLGVLPLSLVFVGMITFNNVCLKYVEVSFYNGLPHLLSSSLTSSPSGEVPVDRLQCHLHISDPREEHLAAHLLHSPRRPRRILFRHRGRDQLLALWDPGWRDLICVRLPELYLHCKGAPSR
jgi:hypothetical protein